MYSWCQAFLQHSRPASLNPRCGCGQARGSFCLMDMHPATVSKQRAPSTLTFGDRELVADGINRYADVTQLELV
jgi:hypothetical protein